MFRLYFLEDGKDNMISTNSQVRPRPIAKTETSLNTNVNKSNKSKSIQKIPGDWNIVEYCGI